MDANSIFSPPFFSLKGVELVEGSLHGTEKSFLQVVKEELSGVGGHKEVLMALVDRIEARKKS